MSSRVFESCATQGNFRCIWQVAFERNETEAKIAQVVEAKELDEAKNETQTENENETELWTKIWSLKCKARLENFLKLKDKLERQASAKSSSFSDFEPKLFH